MASVDIGFIIPTCIQSDIHLKHLNKCLNSIAKFHPNSQIIVINDTPIHFNLNYDNQIEKIKETFADCLDIKIVKSVNPGSGELQTFKVLLENPDFKCEKAVIMQDAMVLLEALPLVEINSLDDVRFLWHFTNHILQWNSIPEPLNDYNSKNYITTHTDLLMDCILTDFRDNMDFQKFAINRLRNMRSWVGCFGCCCIINKSAIKKMDELVPFIDTFVRYTNKRYRCSAETLFALICHFIFPENDFTKSIDGLYYDGMNLNPYNQSTFELEDGLQWCARNKYIGKISFNR